MAEYRKYGAVYLSLISLMTARAAYSAPLVSGILVYFYIKRFFFCSGDDARVSFSNRLDGCARFVVLCRS